MFKFIKRLQNNYHGIIGAVNFYRFNPHSIPFLAKSFCRLGRHDFEYVDFISNNNDEEIIGAKLECFYCGKLKESFN